MYPYPSAIGNNFGFSNHLIMDEKSNIDAVDEHRQTIKTLPNTIADTSPDINSFAIKKQKPKTALQKLQRRASQARHRANVAYCHKRLRNMVPFCQDNGPVKSSISKAELLNCAKDYIVHLENTLDNCLKKKREMSVNLANGQNLLINEIASLEQAKAHFAINFSVDKTWHDYVGANESDSYPNFKENAFDWFPDTNKKDQRIKENVSQTMSEDLGFVSAEQSSQDTQGDVEIKLLPVSTKKIKKDKNQKSRPEVYNFYVIPNSYENQPIMNEYEVYPYCVPMNNAVKTEHQTMFNPPNICIPVALPNNNTDIY